MNQDRREERLRAFKAKVARMLLDATSLGTILSSANSKTQYNDATYE